MLGCAPAGDGEARPAGSALTLCGRADLPGDWGLHRSEAAGGAGSGGATDFHYCGRHADISQSHPAHL